MSIKQNTTYTLPVFMVTTDHVTAATGLSTGLTFSMSKNGAAFSTSSPTVAELDFGWYTIALTATYNDTLGESLFHITATGADPSDLSRMVVANLESDSYGILTHGTYGLSVIHSETSAIHSETTLIHAETTQIHAETTQIHVETSGIKAETTAILSRTSALYHEALGKAVLDTTANTLTLYETDGLTVLGTFTLTTAGSAPIYLTRTPTT